MIRDVHPDPDSPEMLDLDHNTIRRVPQQGQHVLKLLLVGVARTKAAPLSGLTDSTFPAQEGNSSTY
jgi:hypothetical protein